MQDAAFLLPPHSSLLEPIGGCPPDDYMIPRSYLAGLILSNDGTSPNTVLDISAGQCVDSTNAFVINLAAFTKSTGGSWAAGSGSNGMGTGLTIANSTWYHVFAIIKGQSGRLFRHVGHRRKRARWHYSVPAHWLIPYERLSADHRLHSER